MGDKVTNLWKRASDEGENRDEIPWHLKYGGRTLGTFAGIGMYLSKMQLITLNELLLIFIIFIIIFLIFS